MAILSVEGGGLIRIGELLVDAREKREEDQLCLEYHVCVKQPAASMHGGRQVCFCICFL